MADYRADNRLSLSSGVHLSAGYRKAEERYPAHWHDHFEIELILAGEGSCGINGKDYEIPAHSVFFLTPTDFHTLTPKREMALVNISFDETVLSGQELGALLSPAMARAYSPDREEVELLSSAARLIVHEHEIGGDCMRALLTYFLSFLLKKNAVLPLGQRQIDEDGIKRAYTYLELHFKERITLATLATEAGYHPTYFSELFRRVTGEGYADTLARLRVGYARTLLSGGFSVTDACFASGFGSLSAFGAAFRRLVGTSPAAYRRAARK